LGVPFNIAQYSILLRMIAQVVDLQPGEFIWTGGDVHLYLNHLDQAQQQLDRVPFPSPTFKFVRTVTNIDNFKCEDFLIENYRHHSTIKAPVSK